MYSFYNDQLCTIGIPTVQYFTHFVEQLVLIVSSKKRIVTRQYYFILMREYVYGTCIFNNVVVLSVLSRKTSCASHGLLTTSSSLTSGWRRKSYRDSRCECCSARPSSSRQRSSATSPSASNRTCGPWE